jgi:hypothetical protein
MYSVVLDNYEAVILSALGPHLLCAGQEVAILDVGAVAGVEETQA